MADPTPRMVATAQYMLRRPEQTDRLHDAVTAYPKDLTEVKDVLLWQLGASQEQTEQAIRQARQYHMTDRSDEIEEPEEERITASEIARDHVIETAEELIRNGASNADLYLGVRKVAKSRNEGEAAVEAARKRLAEVSEEVEAETETESNTTALTDGGEARE